MAEKLTTLDQLKAALLRSKADSVSRVGELAKLVIDAIEDLGHGEITVTLPAAGWNNRVQIVEDEMFVADKRYRYLVCGDADIYELWSDACVMAENVTVDGQMTFKCMSTPPADMAVNIIRMEVNKT